MSCSRSITLRLASLFCAGSISSAFAQPNIMAEIVTAVDDPTLPANVLVIDLSFDFGTGDSWTGIGLRAEAAGGLTMRYATDPNTGDNLFTAPASGVGGRHVTFVNKAAPQFAGRRFRLLHAAAIAGAYDPSGPQPFASSLLVNVVHVAVPLDAGTLFGYTARAAFNIAGNPEDFALIATDPEDNTPGPFGRVELAVGTGKFPALTAAAWNIVPEPSTLLLLAFGGLVLRIRF